MKIKPYFERLSASKEYRDFQKEHSDSFMIAGFFILDFESGKSLHQIDYYVPSKKKIAAFTIDKGVVMQMLDMMNSKMTPEKLDIKTNIDLDALQGILEDEMKNRSITEEIKKIIAILQTVDGKKIWNLNCVLSGMNILKAHIDDDSQTVLKMEKSSIMDYIKRMPAGAIPGMKAPQSQQSPQMKQPQMQVQQEAEQNGEEQGAGEEGESEIESGEEMKEKIIALKNQLKAEEEKLNEELKVRAKTDKSKSVKQAKSKQTKFKPAKKK